MNDAEFVAEVRRHVIAIIKAVYKRYGINLLDLPAPHGPGPNLLDEPPDQRLVLTGDSPCTEQLHHEDHYSTG